MLPTLLRLDYSETNATIGRFDTLSFIIKGWAVSTTAVVATLSFSARRPIMLVLAITIVPTVLFCLLDGWYKGIQSRCIEHAGKLELLLGQMLVGRAIDKDYSFGHNRAIGEPESPVRRRLLVSMRQQ